jgi:hypothetical protein
LGYLKLLCPMVRNMENNDKSPGEEKKLKLDLREAMTNGFDDDDDIIELKDEVTLPPMEKEPEVDQSDPLDLKFPDDEPAEETDMEPDTLGIETAEAEPEDVIDQADELTFEEEDEDEEDEEIQTHLVEKPLETGGPDEVVEITEFDDILSEDDSDMITLVEEDPQEDEEEFLELIDVEEDSLPELNSFLDEEEKEKTIEIEDEIIQFDGLKEDLEDVELEDFINDSLNEEIRIDDDLEDDLTSSLGLEASSDMNMIDQGSEDEDLDFNIDSREISEKIDQLDTIFFDDTEAQTDLEDQTVSNDEELEEAVSFSGDIDAEDEDEDIRITDDEAFEETMPQPGIAAFDTDHDKIEASIERVIQQNYSEKIESMVVEVIEKAVSKEIDRLKNILLEDNSSESS